LETHRGEVGHQRQTLFGQVECGLPRLKGLSDEADGRKRSEDRNKDRNRAPQQLGSGQMAANALADPLPDRRRDCEQWLLRGINPRHSVPLNGWFPCSSRRTAASPNRSLLKESEFLTVQGKIVEN